MHVYSEYLFITNNKYTEFCSIPEQAWHCVNKDQIGPSQQSTISTSCKAICGASVCALAAEHSSSVVSIQPSIADVQEGQSLELNCFAPGNPPPQVTWTRASGRLSSNHQVIK